MATAVNTEPTTLPPCGATLSELELDAWRGLLRAHASLVKALDAELEQSHGLPLSSYEVLLMLEHAADNRMRMCELAESVLLSRSGLTRLVDRLEREQLVCRVRACDDARGAYAELTPTGRAKLEQAAATHIAGVREHFLRHFSDAELAMLGTFWERVLPSGGGAVDCAP